MVTFSIRGSGAAYQSVTRGGVDQPTELRLALLAPPWMSSSFPEAKLPGF